MIRLFIIHTWASTWARPFFLVSSWPSKGKPSFSGNSTAHGTCDLLPARSDPVMESGSDVVVRGGGGPGMAYRGPHRTSAPWKNLFKHCRYIVHHCFFTIATLFVDLSFATAMHGWGGGRTKKGHVAARERVARPVLRKKNLIQSNLVTSEIADDR
jgi:hypothetical protein